MDQDEIAKLSEMTVQLYYLREDAKAAGEPFLAYLIGMAAVEAEKLSEQPAGAQTEELLERLALSGAAGEAEKPGR